MSQEDLRAFPDGKCVFTMLPAIEWMVDVTYDAGGEATTVTRKLVVPGMIRSTLIVGP